MAEMPWQDQKRVMDEMILRFEKAFRRVDDSFARHVAENTAALERLERAWERHDEDSLARNEDYLAENRAQREALLRILDELKGRPGDSEAA